MNERKKVLLFYNPNAGNALFKNHLDSIIGAYQDVGKQVIPVRATEGAPLDTMMQTMDIEEYDRIAVAGGDGTINVCVNAMMRNGIDLPMAILPAGTANDFAYYFDIPHDIEAMMEVATGDTLTTADIGVCNGKYFINVAAIGNLVDVSQKTDPNLKNTLGTFAYYLKGFSEVVNLRALPVKLTTPEQVYEEKMFFMIVMNGTSAGGLKHLAPTSEANDGLLDVLLFREMPIIKLAPMLFNALQGEHAKDRDVLAFKTNELLVESDVEISTDVDGEHGEALPLKFSVLPNRLRIFCPKD